MATLSSQDFYKNLSTALASSYFFYGDETYLLEDAIKRVHQKIFGSFALKPSENLSLEVFYGSERPIDALENSALSLGFFSTQKMLLIKEAQAFKDKDYARLQKLIAPPIEGTTLVFSIDGALPRNKFYRFLTDKSVTVNFKTPYEREFPQWIQYLAKSHNVTVGSKVPHLLLQLVGPNLLTLNNEIQKLALAIGADGHIDDDAITNWIAQSKDESVFDLAKAFANKDTGQSLALLRRLLFQGQSAVGILTILARHLRILLEIKTSGQTDSQGLAGRLGIPPFFVKDYLRQSTLWNLQQLSSAIQNLRTAESQLKSTPVSATILIENFLLKA